jgi:hypothetical protein
MHATPLPAASARHKLMLMVALILTTVSCEECELPLESTTRSRLHDIGKLQHRWWSHSDT